MNKNYIIFNLKEAQEELSEIIADMESVPDYGYGEFVVSMSHLYHHINTAWNAQNDSTEATDECSQDNFDRWRQFPSAEDLMLDN